MTTSAVKKAVSKKTAKDESADDKTTPVNIFFAPGQLERVDNFWHDHVNQDGTRLRSRNAGVRYLLDYALEMHFPKKGGR